MNMFHFAKLFKQSTGQSPTYRFTQAGGEGKMVA